MAKAKKIGFGKYKNQPYTAIPLDYLEWLCNIPNDGRRRAFPERSYARKEIIRRQKSFNSKPLPEQPK